MKEAHAPGEFPSTVWSRVALAGKPDSSESRAALALLCKAYWQPIYELVRRKCRDEDRAQDLTQAFFAKLLEKGTIARASRDRGRFRAFLRTNCHHFLIDEYRRQDPFHVSIGDVGEPSDPSTPDREFDRDWAMALLGRVLDRLAGEYAESGRSATFEHLKILLTEGRGAVRVAALAQRLGTTEGAVHQKTRRLRVRYREILLEEIGDTLGDPSEVADEIRWLFDAVSDQSRQIPSPRA